MTLELACKDIEKEICIEATCPHVAHGNNMEELMDDMKNHAKEVHGYIDEELENPKTMAIMKKHAATLK